MPSCCELMIPCSRDSHSIQALDTDVQQTITPKFSGMEQKPFYYAHSGLYLLCDCRGFRWEDKEIKPGSHSDDWCWNHLKASPLTCLAPGLG